MIELELPKEIQVSVADGVGSTELRNLSSSPLPGGWAWLEVEACGVCGTDVEYFRRRRGADLGPVILGHETVGILRGASSELCAKWNVQNGQRVALEEFIPCWECERCDRGDYRLCAQTDSRNAGGFLRYGAVSLDMEPGLWGGFAEVVAVHPNSVIYPVPDGVSAELATLFVPISNGIRWVSQEVAPHPGGTVVIFGPGQHALGCVIGAKEAGYTNIVVVGLGRDSSRLALASRLGATSTLYFEPEVTAKEIRHLTGGRGADLVIDIVPQSPLTLQEAIDALAISGTLIVAASKERSGDLGEFVNIVLAKSATILGVRGHDVNSVRPALELIQSKRYPLEELCTHRFGLSDVQRALELAESGEDQAIHVVVTP